MKPNPERLVLQKLLAFFRRTKLCPNCVSPMSDGAFMAGHRTEWEDLMAEVKKVLSQEVAN